MGLAHRTLHQSKHGKTNRQHVGKSLGAGGAYFVGIKVDARDRCIDLQRHAGNAIVSMVTGVKYQDTRKINAQIVPQ